MSDNHGMLDSIDSNKKDRSDLSVGNSSDIKKKTAGIVFFMLAIIIIVVALYFIFIKDSKNVEAEKVTKSTTVSLTDKADYSPDSGAFFDKVKKQLAEQKRLEELENQEKVAVKEPPKVEKPVKVAYVPVQNEIKPITPPPPPKPQVKPQAKQSNEPKPLTPHQRRLTGTVMAQFDGQDNVPPPEPQQSSQEVSDAYNAPAFEQGYAIKRKSLDFLLINGTSIPCILITEIISDYQGLVKCQVAEDVYSANGNALLVERGSVMTGDQSMTLAQGKTRLFTTWRDIETPQGISITVNSLGAGATGASGSEAWIDNHFAERFGGAIMLSFVQDAITAAASSLTRNNPEITFDNSTENAKSMAEIALENSINIPPTGYVQIGTRINILIARDIDMSSVYEW